MILSPFHGHLSPATELCRYRCSATCKFIEIARLSDAIQAPKVLATPQDAYVIYQLEPFKLGRPAPALHVSASENSTVRASHPCPDGFCPMDLSPIKRSAKIRVHCWSGGNCSNSSIKGRRDCGECFRRCCRLEFQLSRVSAMDRQSM